jgi:hypothetical protein
MENSFYYFFSAVPQVLGGILALFGVFVLFKIQALTTELTSSATKLADYAYDYSDKNDDSTILSIRNNFSKTLRTWINSRNIDKIKYILDMNADNKLKQAHYYKSFSIEFDEGYRIYKELIRRTINSTAFTAGIIIFCLAIIPLGNWIICYPAILIAIFIAVIVCVIIAFRLLLTILKKSFS